MCMHMVFQLDGIDNYIHVHVCGEAPLLLLYMVHAVRPG